ncbi:hypothetical protein FS837_000315 [Tulasnella sp. UAMH 9824]|nr:hypothetical protein FS837_000315 [Tulasnella sp. UAMH 9824]
MSLLDVGMVLKYLKRDAGMAVVQKNVWVCLEPFVTYFSLRSPAIQAVKFVEPTDVEAIADGITEVDFWRARDKGYSAEAHGPDIRDRAASRGAQHPGNAPDGAESIESAATEVEVPITKAYDTSTRTLRKVLRKPPAQKESIGPTMYRTTDVLVDHKGMKTQLVSATSAVAPEVDDDELKDELEMLHEERKKEEEMEEGCVRVEERRKAEEKERALVEAEKKRKAEDEAATLRQEEERVRRKLEQVHVSPEIEPRKDWVKRWHEVRAENSKAAQVTRDDREVELRMRTSGEGEGDGGVVSVVLEPSCFREMADIWIARVKGQL